MSLKVSFALSHRPPGIEWADRDLDVAILTIACFYMSRDIHFLFCVMLRMMSTKNSPLSDLNDDRIDLLTKSERSLLGASPILPTFIVLM